MNLNEQIVYYKIRALFNACRESTSFTPLFIKSIFDLISACALIYC